MDNLRLFLPFEKKDNDQRVVAGYATSESLDSQGEIVRIDAIKRALPEYMKYGNIREMHQWSAVGKAVQAQVDEDKKALYLVCKVVDNNAWQKVKEGVYNGFSIGGRILKKVDNEIQDLTLNEISLVDRPANPSATFSLVKFDTSNNMKKDSTGDSPEEPKNMNVYVASHILEIAKELCYMSEMYSHRNKSTGEIDKAIGILKTLAQTELNEADAKKFADLMNDFEKNKTKGWTLNYYANMQKVLG